MNLRVISWNIAGGHKVASLKHLDYQTENLKYFAEKLKEFAPDIVCLQETHTKDIKSSASTLSKMLKMEIVIDSINHPSHIRKGYKLGNAVLSNIKPVKIKDVYYPNPKGQL